MSVTEDLTIAERDTARPRRMALRRFYPHAFLLLLVLLMFGDVLFTTHEIVASHRQYDAKSYFVPVRAFGFGEIAKGNLPLWNPYVYSGVPMLAGFQSALLYPLNLHYLVLPLAKSLNVEIALHVYLLGVFMYAWARNRGLSTYGGVFSAVITMFSAPLSLQIMSGHLAYVSAVAWTPLAFLAVERVVETRRWSWACAGATALTMTILGGHPQAIFGTMIALGPYAAIRWLQNTQKVRSGMQLALLMCAPLLLAAAQLWPAIAASDESIRAGGLAYVWASRMSLPPENLLTWFAPAVFGDTMRSTYWGRWAFWEVCMFFGVTAAAFVLHALVASRNRAKYIWAGLAVALIVLSWGRYAPLHKLAYAVLPGFDSFRCPSRHLFQATLFLALLAGLGFDALRADPRRRWWTATTLGAMAIALAVGAGWVSWANHGDAGTSRWAALLKSAHTPTEGWWKFAPEKVGPTATIAIQSLIIGAIICAVLVVLFGMARRRWAVFAILILGVGELFVFARVYRPTFDLASMRRPNVESALRQDSGDFRVFDRAQDNYPLEIGVHDMWGWDSFALLRYTQLIAYLEGTRAETEMNEFPFQWIHPVFGMLRCKYLIESRSATSQVQPLGNPMPRLHLLDNYRVVTNMEERLATVADLSFRPAETVLLESEPVPAPEPGGASGTVRYIPESTDSFYVEADLSAPALLLVTDSYSKDWQATPQGGPVQETYKIMPANHALQAIPLQAGSHRIRFEYAPAAFRYGVWVSLISCVTLIALWIGALRAERRGIAQHAG